MQPLSYILYNRLYKPFLKLYLKSNRTVRFDGFSIKVSKQVFHPKLFFSTKYFYDFINKQNVKGLLFLEIGSGTGVLSMLAYKKGAEVTAIDVDPVAVENTKFNFSKNFRGTRPLTIHHSDVFENVKPQSFDMIVINPPYYFKNPTLPGQQAWYCGENGEYFEKLFSSLGVYIHKGSFVYMILEEGCDIDRIKQIAAKNKFVFEIADQRKIKWELNFIFSIRIDPSSN